MPEERDGRSEFYGRLTRGAPPTVFVAAGLYGVYRLGSVLPLVAVAMLITMFLRAAVYGLERLGLGRGLSVLAVLAVILAFVGFGTFVGLVIIPRVARKPLGRTSGRPRGTYRDPHKHPRSSEQHHRRILRVAGGDHLKRLRPRRGPRPRSEVIRSG